MPPVSLARDVGRCGTRSRRPSRRRETALDRPDPADHRGRLGIGKLAARPEEPLARRHLEEVRAEPVERRDEVGLARLGDAEHRDHRGDADRDAERRERGAERAGCAGRSLPTRRTSAGSSRLGRAARHQGSSATSSLDDAPSRISTRRGSDAAISRSCVMTTIVVPVGVQLAQQREDLRARLRVEVAGRLVGEDDRRPADERAGDRDALALAAGELRSGGGASRCRARRGRAPPAPRRAARRQATPRVEQPVRDVVERGHARRAGRTAGRRSRSRAPAARRARRRRASRRRRRRPRRRPSLGRSSVPMMCSSVDLPEPGRPDDRDELALGDRRGRRRAATRTGPG